MIEQKPPEGARPVPRYPNYLVTRGGVIWSRPSGRNLNPHDTGAQLQVRLSRNGVASTHNVGRVGADDFRRAVS